MRLAGKTALILGGTGNLGMAVAKRFLQEGAKIVIQGTTSEKVTSMMKDLQYINLSNIAGLSCDITDYDQVQKCADYTVQLYGRIDILINMAGIIRHHPIEELTLEDWHHVIDVNLNGCFYAFKAVIPYMKAQKYGRIVTAASLAARTARPGIGLNYSASKGGVISMTKTLAGEVGKYNITVNVVAPGPIQSEMFFSQKPETVEALTRGIVLNRLGLPEDIAEAVLFLSSDEASWITGQTIDVSGGLVMSS